MKIDRATVDNCLLHSKLLILEAIVLRLAVAIRAAGLPPPQSSALSAALQVQQRELETIAMSFEEHVYRDPKLAHLTDEERALFSDEYRAMIERMKEAQRRGWTREEEIGD